MFTSKPVFLHIGFPKTGTTALQHNFFPFCPGTHYAGKPYTGARGPATRAFVGAITDLDDDAWRGRLAQTFVQAGGLFAGTEDQVLLSEEELSVGSLEGRADRRTIARRLHLLFPRARVIVVLRNQLTLLPSLYGYAMARRDTPLVPFNAWLDDLRALPPSHRGLPLFDYGDLLDLYVELFGRGSVEVLCYEDFLAGYPAFSAHLATSLGVDPEVAARLPNTAVNGRPSRWTVTARNLVARRPWVDRAVAAVPRRGRGALATLAALGPPLDTRASPENERYLRSYYAEGNRRLRDHHGVDVEARGYPV